MENGLPQPVSIPEDIIFPELLNAGAMEKSMADAGYQPLLSGGLATYIRAGWTTTPSRPIEDFSAQIVPDWRNQKYAESALYRPASQVRLVRNGIEIKRFDEGTNEYQRVVSYIRDKLGNIAPNKPDEYSDAA